jgi:hypothetical protein
MPVNTKTLQQLFDGQLGPIAAQEARGAAVRAGKGILQDALSGLFGRSSSSQIDKFRSEISSSGVARTNMFEVKLSPPGQVNNALAQSLVLRCESMAMPGINLATVDDNNIYGPTRSIVEGVTYADEAGLTFLMDKNYEIRKYFQAWIELAYNPSSWNLKYYDDYASGHIEIYQLDQNHQPVFGVKLWEAYPKNYGPIELSQANNELVKLTVNFNYRYWSDIGTYGAAEPSSVPSFSLPDANGVVPDLSQFPIKPAIPQSTSPVRDVSLEP